MPYPRFPSVVPSPTPTRSLRGTRVAEALLSITWLVEKLTQDYFGRLGLMQRTEFGVSIYKRTRAPRATYPPARS